MSEVWINDVDLADYAFVLGADPKHAGAPQFADASAALIGQLGPMWLGEPVQAAARRLLVAGFISATSAALFRTYADELKQLAATGAVRLRFNDRATQEFRDARLVDMTVGPRAAILANLAGDVAMTFELLDPLRYDVQPQGIALTSSRVSLPMGTAPTFPLILVHGNNASLTNPTLTYRDASGESQQTMNFTGTLGANDYLIVDCVRAQVTKSVAGTQSDASSWWTAGDFPVFRAADAWYEESAWPTLEVGGTGTPGGIVTYVRSWL